MNCLRKRETLRDGLLHRQIPYRRCALPPPPHRNLLIAELSAYSHHTHLLPPFPGLLSPTLTELENDFSSIEMLLCSLSIYFAPNETWTSALPHHQYFASSHRHRHGLHLSFVSLNLLSHQHRPH